MIHQPLSRPALTSAAVGAPSWISASPTRAIESQTAESLRVACDLAQRIQTREHGPIEVALAGSLGIAMASCEAKYPPLRMPNDVDLMRIGSSSVSGKTIAKIVDGPYVTESTNHDQWRGRHVQTGTSIEITNPHMNMKQRELRKAPVLHIASSELDVHGLSDGNLKAMCIQRVVAMKVFDLAMNGSGKNIFDLASLERAGLLTDKTMAQAERLVLTTSAMPMIRSRAELREGIMSALDHPHPERNGLSGGIKAVNPLIRSGPINKVIDRLMMAYARR